MMSDIYYGKIKTDRIATWTKNNDPYDILENKIRVNRLGGWDFVDKAKVLFTDETQVDWGSFAYKCNQEQLRQLVEQTKCEIDGLDDMDATAEYGIVFIEQV